MLFEQPFIKMHGLGNDFVIIDGRAREISLSDDDIKLVCDRRFGIGCDQLIILRQSTRAAVKLLIYNPNASRGGACGNASRAVAMLLEQETGKTSGMLEVGSRLLTYRKVELGYEINMGKAHFIQEVVDLKPHLAFEKISDSALVDIGNQHLVCFVNPNAEIDSARLGAMLEQHYLALGRGVNINFAVVLDASNIRLRVWEHGAGLTLACGSGGCATAFAARARGLTNESCNVILPGGMLRIEVLANEILMQGSAQRVYSGIWGQ